MWNKLSQAAALVTGETEEEKDTASDITTEEKLQHQDLLIQQLKNLVRENEKSFQEKTKEYDELSTKFDKFKLQSKAKITHLSKQIKDQDKTLKKEDCDFDDASSSDSSDRSHRGKVLLLKKQLDQAKQQLEKREEESKSTISSYERKISDLESQLNEKNILISSIADSNMSVQQKTADSSPKKDSNVQEMYAQIVYKDSKILDLNNQIMELEKKIMDLQENIKEKDEVLQQRNRAVQLMAEDLNRKGQTTVIELDETRDQMKIMQQNFSSIESDWKIQLEKHQKKIDDLENVMNELEFKLKTSEATVKNLESTRYELSVKNADLQQKIVNVQESASKQCEQFNKEIQGEIEVLKKDLEVEKKHSAELQKTLDEYNAESQNKILKARVEERKKAKKLERELNELKNSKGKSEEMLNLQQRVAELEEEKGSLQLKLIEIEDQVAQIENLKEVNTAVQKDYEEVLIKTETYEKEIKEYQLESTKWEAKSEALQSDFVTIQEKFNILSQEHFKTQEDMTALLEDKRSIESYHNDLKEKYSSLENKYNEMAQNLQQAKDEKVAYELKAIELEEIRDKDEERNKRLTFKIADLEETLNDSSRPFIQLEKENSEIKDNVRILEQEKHELEKEKNEMTSKIASLEIILHEKETEWSMEKEKSAADIADLKVKLKALEDNFDSKTAILRDLEKEKQNIEKDMLMIFNLFNAKDVKGLTSVKDNYEAIILEKNNLVSDLSEKNNIIQAFTTNNQDLQFCIDNLKSKLDSCESELLELNNSISEKNRENHKMLSVLQDKDNTIQTHVESNKHLQSCLDKLKNELSSCKSEIEDLKAVILEKNDVNNKLSSDLDNNLLNIQQLEEVLLEKEALLSKYSEQQNILKERLKEAEISINSESEKSKDKVKIFLDQISDLEKELTLLREELDSKNEVINTVNSELNEVLAKNKDLQEMCEEKDRAIHKRDATMKETLLALENKSSEIESLIRRISDYESMVQSKGSDEKELHIKLEGKNKVIETQEEHLKEMNKKEKELIEHNNLLKNSVVKITEELNLMRSEYEEMKSVLEKQNSDLGSNLLNAREENNSLKQLAENLQSQINEKENLYQNVMKEKSILEEKTTEMSDVTNKMQKDLEVASTSLHSYKSQCEEFSEQLRLMSNDLQKHISLKHGLHEFISFHKQKVENLTDANKLLRNNIISLQNSYSVETSRMGEEIMSRVRDAELLITVIQADNSKLSEQCDSLQNVVNDNYALIDAQKNEINLLQEEKVSLENESANYKNQIKLLESKLKTVEEELNISNMKLSGEKSEIEEMLHKTLAENKMLSDAISESQEKIESLTESSNLLKNKVAEKGELISQLKIHLQSQQEDAQKLQDLLSEKEVENSSISTKFMYLNQCRQHYCSLINLLKKSFQTDIDTSWLESDQPNDSSLENFERCSKEIFQRSSACLLENQSSITFLKEDLKKLKEENSSLLNSYITQKENIANLVSEISGNMSNMDYKFNLIVSSLSEKENSVTHMKSKVDSFKLKFKASKDILSDLALSLCNLNRKACNQIENMYTFFDSDTLLKFDFKEKLLHLREMSTIEDKDLKTIDLICSSTIDEYFKLTDHLNDLLVYKNECIDKIHKEKTVLQEDCDTLKAKLTDSLASEASLKKDFESMKCQLEKFSHEQTIYSDSSNLKFKELEKEAEIHKNKYHELQENINSLVEQIEHYKQLIQENTNEKALFENYLDQLKVEVNELTIEKTEFQTTIKGKEILITQLGEKIDSLANECTDVSSKYQEVVEELKCTSTKLELESTEKMRVIDKLSSLEKANNYLKSAIKEIRYYFTESKEFNIISFADLLDEDSVKILSDLHSCLSLEKSCLTDNKILENQIASLESENKKLSEELEVLLKERNSLKSNEAENESMNKIIKVVETPMEQKLESNLIQQASSSVSEATLKSLEEQNRSLKEELLEYKKKFAKLLSKLKHFKDEKEKLNEKLELSEIAKSEFEDINAKNLDKINFLEEKIALQGNEKITYMTQMQSLVEKNKLDVGTLNSAISEMKERYSILEKDYFKAQHDLQEYKQIWEQTNVSYELLKEDSERLKLMVKNLNEQLETANSVISDLNLQIGELKTENLHLENEAENLRVHANMLLSDNDAFQSCIEKLKTSKNSLEKRIIEMKEKHDSDLIAMEKDYDTKLKNICPDESKTVEAEARAVKIENECAILRSQCTDLQLRVETLQLECETYQKNLNLLEKEKTYFQHQLSEKSSELQKIKINLNDALSRTKSDLPPNNELSQTSKGSQNLLQEENNQIKLQLNTLIEELNFTKEMNTFLQQEYTSKESLFNEKIIKLEQQLQQMQSSPTLSVGTMSQPNVRHLENELQQAMNSLHNQGLRCEELSSEVSKLLEERNILQWKVQQYMQLNPGVMIDQDSLTSTSDLQSIKVESTVPDKQLAALHERLMESERTCQELRKANDALDRALINERDQKRRIEEELDLAKEHITEETRPSDEYRILLGDVAETEMLAETNYLISRNVRTHADKFCRWIRGRKNFIWRTVKSRNYPQLIYLFYIVFIHIWLLSCVFS